MRTVKDHLAVLIGKDINRTGSVQVLDSSAATYLADGEIVVTDIDGTVLTTTTVVGKEKIQLRQGRGTSNPQIVSPIIARSAMKFYKGANYAAATQQVDYIGYNDVTGLGSFDVINNNAYVVTITNINSPNYGSTGLQRLGMYESSSAATHLEISDALALSLYHNTVRNQFEALFKVERVNSNAGAAITGTATTWTVVNGSDTITLNGTVTNVSVGDYVRLGGLTTASPVYKVTAISSPTSVTIDMPYQGTSATLTEASAVEVITAALALAAESGIRLTGITQRFNEIARLKYLVSRWQTNMINGGDTTVVNQTVANPGVGVGNSVIELENQMLGNEGFLHQNATPFVTPRKDAVSTSTYSYVHLGFNEVDTIGLLSNVPNQKEVIVANACTAGTPNTYSDSIQGAASSVVDVLNAWIGTTPGPFVDVTLA